MSATKAVQSATRQLNAVVVSSGLMQKTVKVRIGVQVWNSHLQKNYNQRQHLLVHDPNSSLRTGDIISITSGLRKAKHVKHIVKSIIAPFGEPIEARPRIPTIEEVAAEMDEKRAKKAERRNLRLQAEKEARDAARAQEMLMKGEAA